MMMAMVPVMMRRGHRGRSQSRSNDDAEQKSEEFSAQRFHKASQTIGGNYSFDATTIAPVTGSRCFWS
jgi:hypothetical protein